MNRFTISPRRLEQLKLPLMACVLATVFLMIPQPAGAVPDEVCAECHETAETFMGTPHGLYFAGQPDGVRGTCESCHGSGEAHVESGGEPDLIYNPGKADELNSMEMCISCHSGHQFDDWAFSSHNAAGVGCASCHTVHAAVEENPLPTEATCYGCHSNVKAASYMPSRHPIGTGMLSCTDCHGVHGNDASLAHNGDSRELCFTCHADKEGPFVFEHEPVNEDCMVCHTAHGSVANNLLKQNEPALCLNCHPMHFHAHVESIEGQWSAPQAPGRGGDSRRDSFKAGMTTKCTQCHTAVHGTDHPSEAISTGGRALSR